MAGTEQVPVVWPVGNVLYTNEVELDVHVKHWVGSFLIVPQVPHVEWHNKVKTQAVPLAVYPSGHISTHYGKVGCL